jgi:hypothetical protein
VRRCLALGALLASVVAVMLPAGAQSAATCAGAAAPATFSAEDLEANSQTVFTATHSIQVELSFNSGGPSPIRNYPI